MKTGLLILSLLIGLAFWGDAPLDPDLGWHLYGGAWIFDHYTVPPYDPINTFGDHWINYHWLAELGFFTLFHVGGYPALALFFGFVMSSLFLSLSCIIRRSAGRQTHPLVEIALLLISTLITTSVFSFRPQVVALTLISISLAILQSRRRTRFDYGALITLTILCANIHVYWVIIPLLHLVHSVVPSNHLLKRHLRLHDLSFTFLLCCCGAVSPYGVNNLLLPFEYAFMDPRWKGVIGEFHSTLTMEGSIPYLVVVCGVALFCRPKLRMTPSSVLGVGSLMLALVARKFLGLFGVLGLPIITRKLSVWCRCIGIHDPSPTGKTVIQTLVISLCVFAFGATLWWFPFQGRDYDAEIAKLYPIDACRQFAISTAPPASDRNHLRILTHFNHGGWCRWGAYLGNRDIDIRVTTDGRTQYVPFERYQWSRDILNLEPGWESHLAEWAPDAILTHMTAPLTKQLEGNPEWKISVTSGSWRIYGKVN